MSKTTSTTSEALKNTVTESIIIEYLSSNPHFFADKSDLLLTMKIPHESGKAISLLERQVNLLRERSNEKQENIKHFIANAQDNDALFGKVRQAILSILKTTSMNELTTLIENQLKKGFSASVSKLLPVSDISEDNQIILKPFLTLKKTTCDVLKPEQAKALFPATDEGIASAAIVPINPINRESGANLLLVIGSVKEGHFHSGQDTLFLDFIGDVLAVHTANIINS